MPRHAVCQSDRQLSDVGRTKTCALGRPCNAANQAQKKRYVWLGVLVLRTKVPKDRAKVRALGHCFSVALICLARRIGPFRRITRTTMKAMKSLQRNADFFVIGLCLEAGVPASV